MSYVWLIPLEFPFNGSIKRWNRQMPLIATHGGLNLADTNYSQFLCNNTNDWTTKRNDVMIEHWRITAGKWWKWCKCASGVALEAR